MKKKDRKIKKGKYMIGDRRQIDLILGVVFFFVIIISVIFAYVLMYKVQDRMAPMLNPDGESNASTDALDSAKTSVMMWNKIFYIVVVFFIIATIITSYYLPSNPVLFFLSLIMLLISILLATIFSNAYEMFIDNPAFEEDYNGTIVNNASETFQIPGFTFSILPLVALIFGLVVLAVLYMKARIE